MGKFFAAIFLILLILLGLGYIVYLKAPDLLSHMISKKTKVPVKIEAVHFKSQEILIDNFVMANPPKATLPNALQVSTIRIAAPYKNYFQNPIIIDEIHLQNIYVNIQIFDQKHTKINWNTIIDNMQNDEKSFFSAKRSALIKKLILTNIMIDLITADGKRQNLPPIKSLEFDNINTEKGFPIQEITEIIIKHMMHTIFKQKALESLFQAPRQFLPMPFRPFLGTTQGKNT